MPRRYDGSYSSEPCRHGGLQSRRWVMTVNDIRPHAMEYPEEAHGCTGNRPFANHLDMKAFRAEHFEERSLAGIDADRDIVPIGTLNATKLDDKYLRTSHLKTVDNVDYFHGG